MEEFKKNPSKEKLLIKQIRKNFKRWKIGRWFLWSSIFATVGIGAFSFYSIREDMLQESLVDTFASLIFIMGMMLIPFIVTMIIYAVAIGGGRDILLARTGEKIYLDNKELKNVFRPVYKQLTNADIVEITVSYQNIQSMNWNTDFKCLTIEAEHEVSLFNNGISVTKTETKKVLIYDYYYKMDKLLLTLQEKSGVKIENWKY